MTVKALLLGFDSSIKYLGSMRGSDQFASIQHPALVNANVSVDPDLWLTLNAAHKGEEKISRPCAVSFHPPFSGST